MIVVVGKELPAYVEAAAGTQVRFVDSLDDAADVFGEMEAVVGHVSPDVLAKAPKLRWAHSPSAGVDSDLTPEMRASSVVLTSSAGNGGIPLAHRIIQGIGTPPMSDCWPPGEQLRGDRVPVSEAAQLQVGQLGEPAAVDGRRRVGHRNFFRCRGLGMQLFPH